MALKLRKARPTFEIDYRDGEDSATFRCVILSTSEVAKMAEASTRHVWDSPKKRGPKQRFDKLDMTLFHADKIDHIIKDWEGILDPDGNELPCTRENKLLIEEVNPEIIDFVLEEVDRIAEGLEKEDTEELGNSEPSPNGSLQET